MNNCNNVNFYGVKKIGDSHLLDQLEDNFKSYLDNGFLHIGSWINVNIPRATVRKDFLHEELVEFTTRSGLLLNETLATSGSCLEFNTLGGMRCTNSLAYPNPYIKTYTYNSNEVKIFNVVFDAYGVPEALKVTISGSAGVVDLIDTGMITGSPGVPPSYIDDDGTRHYLYGDGAFTDTITKPTGYDTLILEITNDLPECTGNGLTGHYFSLCESKEILEIVESSNNCRAMINVDFDPSPNIDNSAINKRLRILASGTSTGNTISMLDTGFVNDIVNYSIAKPSGYDNILFYVDPNGYHLYPTKIDADYTELCEQDLQRTIDTVINQEDYVLGFDAYADSKKITILANSGSSSIELLDTGYISGTNTGLLDCILGSNPGDNASYISFNKPSGYESVTIKFDENNRYDDVFYISLYTETEIASPDYTSLYGDLPHQLKTTEVNGYKIGQVWQSFRKDWVWETGVKYYPDPEYCNNFSPINISGIYVNNNFLAGPTGVANSGYHINYPLGQIIFDKAIPKTSKVELDYSYRWCQVYKSSTDSSWKELQELTYSPNPALNQPNVGDYSISANHRAQLPCIIIEPSSRTSSKPYQLGGYSQYQSQDFLLHVFTENSVDKNRICDIIRLQKDQMISLYDINKVVNSGLQPLNYDGSFNDNGLSYRQLLQCCCWNKTMLKDFGIVDMESKNKNITWCIIRLTSETIT